MASQDIVEPNPRIAELEVVDCDFHVSERSDDFLPYLPDPFDQIIDIREGEHHSYGFYPSPALFSSVSRGNAEKPEVRTREAITEAKEWLGADRVVVTPTLNLYLGCVQHDELAGALAHAYNEWLLNEIVDIDDGIYGAALIAPQKPNDAAEEIDDRASEPGIVSAFFPSGGIIPLPGHKTYHPIYQACEDNGLPISMHAASGNTMMSFPLQYQLFNRSLPNHLVSHPMMAMTNMADMITRGIPVRFPDLDFVIQETGLGYIPYFMRRFDHEYHAKTEDAPMLEKKPSEYIRDRFYFTSQPIEGTGEPSYVSEIVQMFDGESNLLFSSDYPHPDFDNSDELLKLLSGFEESAIKNIYGKTAFNVYDF